VPAVWRLAVVIDPLGDSRKIVGSRSKWRLEVRMVPPSGVYMTVGL